MSQPQSFTVYASAISPARTIVPQTDTLAPNERWRVLGLYLMAHGALAVAAGGSVTAIVEDGDGFEFARAIFYAPAASNNTTGGMAIPWIQFGLGGVVGRQPGAPIYLRLISPSGALSNGYILSGMTLQKEIIT